MGVKSHGYLIIISRSKTNNGKWSITMYDYMKLVFSALIVIPTILFILFIIDSFR